MRRISNWILIVTFLGCAAGSLVMILEALEERQGAVAATDLRLAVIAVSSVLEVDNLDERDQAFFEDSQATLRGDLDVAVHGLPADKGQQVKDDIAVLLGHAEMITDGSLTRGMGHSVADHDELLDTLRDASIAAAEDAAAAERSAALLALAAGVLLAGLSASLLQSRARSQADIVQAEAYRSAADRFGTLLDQSPDATAVIGGDGIVTYASAAMHRLLGNVPHTQSDLLKLATDKYRPKLEHHLVVGKERDEALCIGSQLEVPAGSADREFDVRVVDLSDDPLVGGRLVTFVETTSENRARRQLEHLAGHDQLTGLPNRRSMMTALATDSPSALLMIDLDGFKKTNDTLGHGAGDELLVAISQRFEAALPAGTTLFRLGGDEFAALLNTTFDVARRAAADLLDSLAEPVELSMAFERASASIGVAHRDAGDGSISLLRRADIALYDAKRSGGGTIRALDADLERRSVRTSELGRAFQNATFDAEFHLAYQSIVTASTGDVQMIEALARWTSPIHGPVGPDQFIPLAEASGRIVELGNWVLEQALASLATWRAAGLSPDVCMSVNVSPYQLTSEGFPERVNALLRTHAIDAESLVIELTESALVGDDEQILSQLRALRALGCSVACDDFGSGYSNLGQLMKLPLNLIKIDRQLLTTLHAMREESGDADRPCQVMSAMVSIGDAMNASIVAEGVETQQQATSLRKSGVQLLQGYLFSRPVGPDHVMALFADQEPIPAIA